MWRVFSGPVSFYEPAPDARAKALAMAEAMTAKNWRKQRVAIIGVLSGVSGV